LNKKTGEIKVSKERYLVGVLLDNREVISEFPTEEQAKAYVKQIQNEFEHVEMWWGGFEMFRAKEIKNPIFRP
jgi:hypothetical protein